MARPYAYLSVLTVLWPAYFMALRACLSGYFLKAELPGGTVKFHALENTDSAGSTNVTLPDISPFNHNNFETLRAVTSLHVFLIGFLLLTHLHGTGRARLGHGSKAHWESHLYLVATTGVFAFILTLFDLAAWGYVEHRLLKQGIHAELGNALWYMILVCLNLLASWYSGKIALKQMEDEDLVSAQIRRNDNYMILRAMTT